MAPKKSTSTQTIYQLKITLKYTKPPIWRRVLVKNNTTLGQLHRTVQEAMGWDDYHLHSWNIGGMEYGIPHEDYDSDMGDEKNVKLSKLIGSSEKIKFYYTYDFGDSWEHEILVEKILPSAPDTRYPVCVTGKRACPPEDCGGAWGYAELLSTLNDPENAEYEERMEWLEGEFDPEKFDLKEINSKLQCVYQ
ncbi:plasmid pRiA4b ORF-3 family protein [Dulcicalothrix desertica PCC 7102]|uniref:Plasmid pRiA4b ORF-3 family protein n=1 Tax=Dulcicalothrix desertica PCC 7102 TaxID=232991 RepID=A0A3S1ALP6_9CYAN|nr:plasmid pRiA4b ORF-3 family protein [Dulcicalothrix desertica]RUT03794.1 plasmid pRiA4b ORF-3 family protein [Dulcicalothrix desertica PCC 7102]TWH43797.1 pRiA4b ORF-3-like protein [Dulcicalothrix desertica PCC 7102]